MPSSASTNDGQCSQFYLDDYRAICERLKIDDYVHGVDARVLDSTLKGKSHEKKTKFLKTCASVNTIQAMIPGGVCS